MEITINLLEAASELADLKLNDTFTGEIYIESENEIRYTDPAQEYFDELYDEFYHILDSLRVDNPSIETKGITLEKLDEILKDIDAEYQGVKFEIFRGDHKGNLWIQVGTERPDTYTGESGIGKGGKAYVSEFATHDEIVKKVFGLCMSYVEHEAREGFKWKGRRVFNPHVSIEALYSVALKSNYRD